MNSGSKLNHTLQQARTAAGADLDALLYHPAADVLEAVIENPHMGEQHVAVLLARRDLPRSILLKIARRRDWMSSYPLKLAVLRNPRTPRSVALPLLKFIFLFDLMGIALDPGVTPELKRLAEDAVLSQRDSVALGERISLARRGSQRIAAALLADPEAAVVSAALGNPRLTSSSIAASLLLPDASPHLTHAVAKHTRWSANRSIKEALARSPHLTLGKVVELLRGFSPEELRDFASDRRVASNVR